MTEDEKQGLMHIKSMSVNQAVLQSEFTGQEYSHPFYYYKLAEELSEIFGKKYFQIT